MLLQQIEKLRNDLTNTTKEESPIENYLKDKKIELTDDEKQVVNLLKEFSIKKQKSIISFCVVFPVATLTNGVLNGEIWDQS